MNGERRNVPRANGNKSAMAHSGGGAGRLGVGSMQVKAPILVGIAAGVLFFAHAMFNNSHAWPLIWPALAGAVAVFRGHRGRVTGYGADIARAGIAGVSAGAIFIGATAIALSSLGLFGTETLAGLAVAAVLGLVAAVVLGGLTHPIATRRT